MTTRYANLLIDTADRLARARTAEEAWSGVNAVAHNLHANAVNVGMFLAGTDSIAWMRSSMTADWLDEYAGCALFEIDPLLKAAMAGHPPPCYDVGRHYMRLAADPRQRQLHGSMLGHGYRYMLSHRWTQGTENKCLVLSCEDDPTDLFGPGTARAFRAVSAMLSYSLHAPGADNPETRVFGVDWQALSPQEVDVLSFLALGMTENDIAGKSGLDLEGVLRSIAGAGVKMRAGTRDQTLALAMMRGLLPL